MELKAKAGRRKPEPQPITFRDATYLHCGESRKKPKPHGGVYSQHEHSCSSRDSLPEYPWLRTLAFLDLNTFLDQIWAFQVGPAAGRFFTLHLSIWKVNWHLIPVNRTRKLTQKCEEQYTKSGKRLGIADLRSGRDLGEQEDLAYVVPRSAASGVWDPRLYNGVVHSCSQPCVSSPGGNNKKDWSGATILDLELAPLLEMEKLRHSRTKWLAQDPMPASDTAGSLSSCLWWFYDSPIPLFPI